MSKDFTLSKPFLSFIEVKEETGLDLEHCKKREVLGHVLDDTRHYVTVYMSGTICEVIK